MTTRMPGDPFAGADLTDSPAAAEAYRATKQAQATGRKIVARDAAKTAPTGAIVVSPEAMALILERKSRR